MTGAVPAIAVRSRRRGLTSRPCRRFCLRIDFDLLRRESSVLVFISVERRPPFLIAANAVEMASPLVVLSLI